MEENKTEQGYCYKYPRPAVTIDVVLFAMVDSQMKVLLIQRGRDPYKGQWAFPGGFLNMDETAEVGALRELKEGSVLMLSSEVSTNFTGSAYRPDSDSGSLRNLSESIFTVK